MIDVFTPKRISSDCPYFHLFTLCLQTAESSFCHTFGLAITLVCPNHVVLSHFCLRNLIGLPKSFCIMHLIM